jgi:glycosyltransferase involved in cell wall biosynthesis
MPTVSVIMATYNRAETLRACIESVLNQDFHDFEFIIIDDGSTDGSIHLLRAFCADPRVSVYTIPNGGQANALNFGLSRASGKYVAFLDSDDEYRENHLSTLLAACATDGLDFVLGGFEVILCGDQNKVIDYYNQKETISIHQVECITGVIFGRRERVIEAGGFESKFPDTHLFEKMKRKGFAWKKLGEKTYRYFFGRCSNNVSWEILKNA